MTISEIQARRDAVFGKGAPLFYEEPLNIVKGEGVYLYGADGTRYLDMYNNVPCVGHCHPHVVEAMAKQAATLNVHSRYINEGVLAYSERLVGKHADGLDCLVMTCTGTEADEVAIAMARAASGGRGIICTDRGYHGNTELMNKFTFAGFKNDPELRPIPFPQKYRPIEEGLSDEALCDRYLVEVQRAIDSFAEAKVPLAGMLACSILANEGLPDIPGDYMARAAEMVRKAGGLFIADEVQAGFCRTGHWWGYEATGFVPDIATHGKPMGNGLPVGGTVANSEVVAGFRAKGYFNTFAASPLQAATANAVLDVIENEGLKQNVADTGAYLRAGLEKLEHPCIGDVRGHGLFLGIEWVADQVDKTVNREGALRVVNRLKDKGYLISSAGSHGSTLKVRPPLVFAREHADDFLGALEETLRELD